MSYLKALSNFGKQLYGLTLHPYCIGEGFRTGCYSSTSGKRVLSTPVCNLHLEEYERNNLSPCILSFN